MEQAFDENGVEIDLSTILTMTFTVEVTGESGTKFYFIRNKQYITTKNTARKVVSCKPFFIREITYSGDYIIHWEVVIDDESFWIPEEVIAFEYRLRKPFEQDKYEYLKHLSDEPRDFIKTYREVTGIDLRKRLQDENNGYDYWKENKNKMVEKGKKYGEYHEDSEEEAI